MTDPHLDLRQLQRVLRDSPAEALQRLEGALGPLLDLLEATTRELRDAGERLAELRARLIATEQHELLRLDKELALAKDIQSSLLPRDLTVEAFEVAATMLPCAEVGGDYYDVRPVPGGCWIGIGDVSGHGVSAGLVMLMVQSVAAALIGCELDERPSEVLSRLNEVLYENIRGRMASDEYVTASLLRFHADGQVVYAGAHEDLLVLRAATGRCERIETSGVWLGVLPDIRHVCVDEHLTLRPGDMIVLHTDGLTEAADASGERFGLERVCAELERIPDAPPQVVLSTLIRSVTAFAGPSADDLTVLVLRYLGDGRGGP